MDRLRMATAMGLVSTEVTMSDQPNTESVEVEALGAKLRASPDSIARTVAAVGTFFLLAAVLYWEAMHGRPAMVSQINDGWRDADERHQKRLTEQQEKADARLDKLVERHSEAISSLKDAITGQRKVAITQPPPTDAKGN